jgi:hypothetical protein
MFTLVKLILGSILGVFVVFVTFMVIGVFRYYYSELQKEENKDEMV